MCVYWLSKQNQRRTAKSLKKNKVLFRDYCKKGKETSVWKWNQLLINMSKWGFAPKEQGGGLLDGKLLRRTSGIKGGFWLNLSDRILAESRLRWSDITWATIGYEEFFSDMESEGFWINYLNRIFAKIGRCKDKHRRPWVKSQLKRGFRGAWVWSEKYGCKYQFHR